MGAGGPYGMAYLRHGAWAQLGIMQHPLGKRGTLDFTGRMGALQLARGTKA